MQEGSRLRWMERTGVGICAEDVCMVFRKPTSLFSKYNDIRVYVGDILSQLWCCAQRTTRVLWHRISYYLAESDCLF